MLITILRTATLVAFQNKFRNLEIESEKQIRSREEDEVAGFFVFSQIRMRGYFKLD